MRGFERAVEWLRPFVDSKVWDFCILWKLGDDPSRFIQWKDCCCSGGFNIKVERDEFHEKQSGQMCRDSHLQHSIRSKACEALSLFPPFISLYAGVHGEVAMSNQSKWINHGIVSTSHSSHEKLGTQVVIPVFGGLIELFVSKHMPIDQNMIELVTTQCNALLVPESMTAEGYTTKANIDKLYHNMMLERDLHNLPLSINLSNFTPRIQALPPVSSSNLHLTWDGSSSASSLSDEHLQFTSASAYISQDEQLKQLIGTYCGTDRLRCFQNQSEQQSVLVFDSKSVKDKMRNTTKQPDKDNNQSKNLVTERNRRKRIKDGLFSLRALVPNISKMDRSAILTDAIDYIGDLQEEVKKLKDELNKIEEENFENSNAQLKSAKGDRLHRDNIAVEQNQVSSSLTEMAKKQEVHVEVNQITEREFLIKLYYEHKRGQIAKVLEGMDCLGLQVIDANVTTFNGKVLNIFKVEANNDFQSKKLRDLLIELTA